MTLARKKTKKKAARKWRRVPSGFAVRKTRALGQPLFVLASDVETKGGSKEGRFVVTGSTGNLYTVVWGVGSPSCTCPDAGKGYVCKHIIFVGIRVLKLATNSKLLYNPLLAEDVEEVFANVQIASHVMASSSAQVAYAAAVSGTSSVAQRPVEGDCPICFDDLDSGGVVWCKGQCGNNIHSTCMKTWLTHGKGGKTCPMCRAPWIGEGGAPNGLATREGYANIARYESRARSHRPMSSGWGNRRYDRLYWARRRAYDSAEDSAFSDDSGAWSGGGGSSDGW